VAKVKRAIGFEHNAVRQGFGAAQVQAGRCACCATGWAVDDAKAVFEGLGEWRRGVRTLIHNDHTRVGRQTCKTIAGVDGFVV